MRLSKIQQAYVSLIQENGEVAINREDPLFQDFMKIIKKGGLKISNETKTHTYFAAW